MHSGCRHPLHPLHEIPTTHYPSVRSVGVVMCHVDFFFNKKQKIPHKGIHTHTHIQSSLEMQHINGPRKFVLWNWILWLVTMNALLHPAVIRRSPHLNSSNFTLNLSCGKCCKSSKTISLKSHSDSLESRKSLLSISLWKKILVRGCVCLKTSLKKLTKYIPGHHHT